MKKSDCLKWAEALASGKYEKLIGRMSNGNRNTEPTACCCLNVANELFKPEDYMTNREFAGATNCAIEGIFKYSNPLIFDVLASHINDGIASSTDMIKGGGMSHDDIATLLLLSIESGDYINI